MSPNFSYIAVAGGLWAQVHPRLLLSWLRAMPEDTLLARPDLCPFYAWVLFLQDQWSEASQQLPGAGGRGNKEYVSSLVNRSHLTQFDL